MCIYRHSHTDLHMYIYMYSLGKLIESWIAFFELNNKGQLLYFTMTVLTLFLNQV